MPNHSKSARKTNIFSILPAVFPEQGTDFPEYRGGYDRKFIHPKSMAYPKSICFSKNRIANNTKRIIFEASEQSETNSNPDRQRSGLALARFFDNKTTVSCLSPERCTANVACGKPSVICGDWKGEGINRECSCESGDPSESLPAMTKAGLGEGRAARYGL